ncbi:hypothetical protein [Spiroplasma endosymbiont of Amphibalanus improvisus]|uniref:hypothetical protein n=1 Tax=Spiroplasma endosymbiont of Amphibalanus improvisus TaxID=3066327 RepID=UPI00313E657C
MKKDVVVNKNHDLETMSFSVIENELNNLITSLNNIDFDITELQERIALGGKSTKVDLEDFESEIAKLDIKIQELSTKANIHDVSLYLIFIEAKMIYRIIKVRIEDSKKFIDLYSKIKKD